MMSDTCHPLLDWPRTHILCSRLHWTYKILDVQEPWCGFYTWDLLLHGIFTHCWEAMSRDGVHAWMRWPITPNWEPQPVYASQRSDEWCGASKSQGLYNEIIECLGWGKSKIKASLQFTNDFHVSFGILID